MNTEMFSVVNDRADRKRSALDSLQSEQLFFEIANRSYEEKHRPKVVRKKKVRRRANMALILANSLAFSTIVPVIGAKLCR